ncbi:MAG: T9SS type A sorting domain-containing protein, partial [Paludibacteraceae bacterium]|nr:T9SS type A sorting domain-containing protein [Paludibacteraceae bacterium]
GPLKVPASRYYTRYENNPAKVGDGTQPKTFEFTGRFANESAMPQYSATTSWTFVNNSYPANLNVAKLRNDNSGLDVKVYDYVDKNWDTEVPISEAEGSAVYVKPNNGFAIKASSAMTITTNLDEYGSGSTIYYKRAFDDTYLRLRAQNTSDAAASTLTVRYGGEMIDKAFSYNETTPDIYVKDGDAIYSSYGIDDAAKVIPVCLRNKQANKNLTVKFSLSAVEGFESVILEDRLNSKTYNLTEGETPVFSGIAPGDCIGRFYLNINYAYEDVTSVDEGESDGFGSESRGIEIYEANGKQVVISSSDNVMLEQVYITDMSGRTTVKTLSDAHYNVLTLDGAQGVYVIKAVGDAMSKTEKVIVK